MAQPVETPVRTSQASRKTEAAFDVWLQSGLHQMYDDVAREPVPDDLLKLVNEGRKA